MRSLLPLALVFALLLPACGPTGDGPDEGAAGDEAATDARVLFPVVQDGRWGFIDRTGAVVVAPQFRRAWRFSGSRALVRDTSGFGYLDRTGAVAITPRFADAWHFADGLAPVEVDGRWGFVDTTGAVVVEPRFELPPGVLVEGRRRRRRRRRWVALPPPAPRRTRGLSERRGGHRHRAALRASLAL